AHAALVLHRERGAVRAALDRGRLAIEGAVLGVVPVLQRETREDERFARDLSRTRDREHLADEVHLLARGRGGGLERVLALPDALAAGFAHARGEDDAEMDATGRLLYDLERQFDEYRLGVTQMVPDRAVALFAKEFEGDTLFDAKDEGEPAQVGHVTIVRRGR